MVDSRPIIEKTRLGDVTIDPTLGWQGQFHSTFVPQPCLETWNCTSRVCLLSRPPAIDMVWFNSWRKKDHTRLVVPSHLLELRQEQVLVLARAIKSSLPFCYFYLECVHVGSCRCFLTFFSFYRIFYITLLTCRNSISHRRHLWALEWWKWIIKWIHAFKQKKWTL